MAIFHITPADSVFTDLFLANAFDSDTPAADTLIVDPSAFLIATNVGAGASLHNTGAWTVIINGSIVSQNNVGINLLTGNAAVSTITIGLEGEVQGPNGIFLNSSANINNGGTIAAETGGGIAIVISNGGAHTITNSGEIIGSSGAISVISGDSNDTVHNSGEIIGNITLSGGNDTVTNSSSLFGSAQLGNGTNHLTNSGSIDGSLLGGSGTDTVTNSHLINGDAQLFDGNNTLTNSGTIGGKVFGGSDNDILINSGTIGDISQFSDRVLLGDGTNTLTNSGTIAGNVVAGSGSDTVMDFAIVGDVMKSGTINGTISLGDGNDTFTGGAKREIVQDGNGADSYNLGGGNDTYIATSNTGGNDGIDIVKGGAGTDTYDASAATTNCRINLDTVAHDFAPFNPGAGLVAADTATGTDISGTLPNVDKIFGFEIADGGAGNDIIYGTAAANLFNGNNGNDFLFGFGGNDTLAGQDGNDDLVGGPGKDRLFGDLGADVFHYTAVSDSGITAATRDLIFDFEAGTDKIDLSLIDANKTTPGKQAFTFIGTNVKFDGHPGELRAYWTAGGQIIEGDVNGDAKADLSIELLDPTHAITLGIADFDPPSAAVLSAPDSNNSPNVALLGSYMASTFPTASEGHGGTLLTQASQSVQQATPLALPHA